MPVILNKHSLVHGVGDHLPLKGFPDGRVKIVQRNNDFVKAYVKTDTGIRQFYVSEKDGFWVPMFEQGSNQRT